MKLNRCSGVLGGVASMLLLVACTGGENPQLTMCKTVTGNLVGSVSEWKSENIDKGDQQMKVKLVYKDNGGSQGEAVCVYRKPASARDDNNAQFPTAPTSVTLNGETVGTKALIAATGKAGKEVLENMAAETARQTRELADETRVKAEELTEEASRVVEQAKQKAGEVAGELGAQARDKLKDAAEDLKQKLQQ